MPYTQSDRRPYFNGSAQALGVDFGHPFGWSQDLRYNANQAASSYNALQVRVDKRFSNYLKSGDLRAGSRERGGSASVRKSGRGNSPPISGRAFSLDSGIELSTCELPYVYFGMTSRAKWLATTSRISLRFRAASKAASRDP
jgi:hypothetical protein